jgi:predicted phosphate transport protein (TIGR00153 family)
MFEKLLPRSTNFFAFFEQHIVVVIKAAKELQVMMPLDSVDRAKQAIKIKILEREADVITHQCIDALHKTFITPFERDDIYSLITRMDDIIDIIEDVSKRIVLYKLDTRTRESTQLVKILCDASFEIQNVLAGMKTGDTDANLIKILTRIRDLEREGDDIVNRHIGQLFDEEKDPINLIKWKEIYEYLEDAVDCCETVANIVEGMLIERS